MGAKTTTFPPPTKLYVPSSSSSVLRACSSRLFVLPPPLPFLLSLTRRLPLNHLTFSLSVLFSLPYLIFSGEHPLCVDYLFASSASSASSVSLAFLPLSIGSTQIFNALEGDPPLTRISAFLSQAAQWLLRTQLESTVILISIFSVRSSQTGRFSPA